MRSRRQLAGHLYTLAPVAKALVRPPKPPSGRPWSVLVRDPLAGEVPLTGTLHQRGDSDTLLMLVHGLGGSAESEYIKRATMVALEAGLDVLRLNLRGADGGGLDFYHAALTEDLRAAASSPALAGYRRLYVMGYSLGGHVTLRWAAEGPDPRVQAVASVCAPLDLAATQRHLDKEAWAVYRHYILVTLKKNYRAVARNAQVPSPLWKVGLVRSIRRWDELTVVPRFGFAGVDEYYQFSSAGPWLNRAKVPTLVVSAEHDPFIPADSVRPWLSEANAAVEARWCNRGGHVGLPPDADIGSGPGPLEPQVIEWLMTR